MPDQPKGNDHRGLGEQVGRTLDSAIDKTVDTAEAVAKSLTRLKVPRLRKVKPGSAPGIEHDRTGPAPPSQTPPKPLTVTCIDFSKDRVVVNDVADNAAFLQTHREPWVHVRWVNVVGLHDLDFIRDLGKKYRLHPLALEDMVHTPQRAKAESFEADSEHGARLFIVLQMLQLVDGAFDAEQVSIFLGHNTVITFQQRAGDVWGPIRDRLNQSGSRLRLHDASFLMYALVDAIVDHCFPLIESYGDRLEDIEFEVLDDPRPATMHQIHVIKREMLLFRRQVWPMREMIGNLVREPHECLSPTTVTYLRDVQDHAVQVLDILETYREIATGLADSYMSSISNRMNEVMKVLTIIASLFIPVSFLAGVFGMNFDDLPLLHSRWGFGIFCVLCASSITGMLFWFRSRDWI